MFLSTLILIGIAFIILIFIIILRNPVKTLFVVAVTIIFYVIRFLLFFTSSILDSLFG